MQLPCYLTIYEQVTWPKLMAKECERLGLRVILLDNASTYPPCREWLDSCHYEVIRMGYNSGCYGFFRSGMHLEQTGPYVLSDSDLDLSGVPADAVVRLQRALDLNPTASKAGLSLEINDIPADYKLLETVHAYEKRLWVEPLPGDCFKAGVGATFALYEPGRCDFQDKDIFYNGIRLDRPYTARHLPWYLNFDALDEEQAYYYAHCDNTAHYGSLIKKLLKESKAND